MTTLDDVAKRESPDASAEAQAAVELVRLAQERGLSLTGPDGLLKHLTKTVLTGTTGAVELDLPRDRAATFEPQIVKKRQHRLSGVDEVVLPLNAKGLTAGQFSAPFAEIYGASVPVRLPRRVRRRGPPRPRRHPDSLELTGRHQRGTGCLQVGDRHPRRALAVQRWRSCPRPARRPRQRACPTALC